ncbi:MAG: lipid IV(A) 3-deoxy-D-manno-octulosonic acid transferase [Pseudomonadales bacterium]
MNRFGYTLLYYFLLPVVFARLLLRARKAPLYRKRWGERLGFFKAPSQTQGLWLHSVSVGETIASAPLVKQIQQHYPDLPITITTMTPTGSERVKALFGDSVFHVYVPYDTPAAVRRFLKKVQPRLALIMETELWPNLIDQCSRRQLPVLIANARLSARSARGYGRFPKLIQAMLQQVDCIAAQTEADGQRFVELGLAPKKLQVTGSVKFDIQVSPELLDDASELRKQWGAERPVWIAASTHQGEDEPVLQAFKQLLTSCPQALLVLVPRHPERFSDVAQLCRTEGFDVAIRSEQQPVKTTTQVLLADTMGELMLLYAASDIAFVGGSLVATGGHNFLEPAVLAMPVIAGPHVFNFTEISQLLIDAGGMTQRETPQALAGEVKRLIDQPNERLAMGQAALSVVKNNGGAQQRMFELIESHLG